MTHSADIALLVEDEIPNASGFIHVHCPECQSPHELKRKLWMSTRTGWWKCWSCDIKGRLGEGWEDEDDGWEDVEETVLEIEDPSEYHLVTGESLALEPARQYLRDRDVPANVWSEARLGYARKGKHGKRIIMPIWNDVDTWIGWVGAATYRPARVPYWTAAGTDRESTFYNDIALQAVTDAPLFVTEGPFDALRHWPNAVACLGKPTSKQISRLRRCTRPLVVALDGDAWKEGVGVAESLRVDGLRAYALVLPPGEDLDSTPMAVAQEAARYAMEHHTDVDTRTD